MGNGRSWTQVDEQFLCQNLSEHGVVWCAKELGRTATSIRKKSAAMDLHAVKRPLVCSVEGCTLKHSARGLCVNHYRTLPERRAAHRDYCRGYYTKNAEKVKANAQAYRLSNKEAVKQTEEFRNSTISRRYYHYKEAATKRAREFKLTVEQFKSLTELPCSYCGQFSPGKEYTGIDRIDSSKGYEFENCAPCCSVCNWMKSDLTVAEFETHILRIIERLARRNG